MKTRKQNECYLVSVFWWPIKANNCSNGVVALKGLKKLGWIEADMGNWDSGFEPGSRPEPGVPNHL